MCTLSPRYPSQNLPRLIRATHTIVSNNINQLKLSFQAHPQGSAIATPPITKFKEEAHIRSNKGQSGDILQRHDNRSLATQFLQPTSREHWARRPWLAYSGRWIFWHMMWHSQSCQTRMVGRPIGVSQQQDSRTPGKVVASLTATNVCKLKSSSLQASPESRTIKKRQYVVFVL